MARVIGYTERCYEVQEVSFGSVYRWHPERVVIQCDCGKRPILTGYKTTCNACGANHAVIVREETADRRVEDEVVHPWRSWRPSGDTGIPF